MLDNKNVLPVNNPDGSITFPSQHALDLYVSAVGEVEYNSVMDFGFEIGRKQALEVIDTYPDKTPGQNQFKQDIYKALDDKSDDVDNVDWVRVSMVKDLLLHMLQPVVFGNGYPIRAVSQADILSLKQMIRVWKKNKIHLNKKDGL